ncbi:MAG: ABC transporter ATP-binding protein [Beutenbergiaceae bacterium]
MAIVRFDNVTKRFGSHTIVDGLNLTLEDGSMTVMVGPSGCGKSTSLRMLAGLEPITSGRVVIGDRDVTQIDTRDRDVSMVFQNYALYPHLTVRRNIAFPLGAKKVPRTEATERAELVAQSVGLSELLDRRPKDLSGGQQQRVAIARAIVREPSVFLFDEPLSNLDAKLRVETRTELLRIQRNLGITALYVTHDQEEAMTLSDCMVVMREGGIAQIGAPVEVYSRPRDTFVASFIGSPKMNLIDGEAGEAGFQASHGYSIDTQVPVSGPVTLGVRPDDLLLERYEAGQARIALIELLGPRAIIALELADAELTCVAESAALVGMQVGDRVRLAVRPGAAHYFDIETGQRITDHED